MVLHCERCLVLQEGFATEELFASVPRASFHAEYLKDVGVTGLGLQTFLLQMHRALHVPHDPPLPLSHCAALPAESFDEADEGDEADEAGEADEATEESLVSVGVKNAAKGDNKRKREQSDTGEQTD